MAARKNYTAAQIINGLRRAEVGLANGKSMKEVIRDLARISHTVAGSGFGEAGMGWWIAGQC